MAAVSKTAEPVKGLRGFKSLSFLHYGYVGERLMPSPWKGDKPQGFESSNLSVSATTKDLSCLTD